MVERSRVPRPAAPFPLPKVLSRVTDLAGIQRVHIMTWAAPWTFHGVGQPGDGLLVDHDRLTLGELPREPLDVRTRGPGCGALRPEELHSAPSVAPITSRRSFTSILRALARGGPQVIVWRGTHAVDRLATLRIEAALADRPGGIAIADLPTSKRTSSVWGSRAAEAGLRLAAPPHEVRSSASARERWAELAARGGVTRVARVDGELVVRDERETDLWIASQVGTAPRPMWLIGERLGRALGERSYVRSRVRSLAARGLLELRRAGSRVWLHRDGWVRRPGADTPGAGVTFFEDVADLAVPVERVHIGATLQMVAPELDELFAERGELAAIHAPPERADGARALDPEQDLALEVRYRADDDAGPRSLAATERGVRRERALLGALRDDPREIVLWQGGDPRELLLIRRACSVLEGRAGAISEASIAFPLAAGAATFRGVFLANPRDLVRAFEARRVLSPAEVADLGAEWRALASSGHLLWSVDASMTLVGSSYEPLDEAIRSQLPGSWTRGVRVVGAVLGDEQPGCTDRAIWRRVRALVDRGEVELRGDARSMLRAEIRARRARATR